MIAADTLSFLFDPKKATEKLEALEQDWGGTPTERMAKQRAAFRAARAIEKGEAPPPGAADAADAAGAAANATRASNATEAGADEADDAPPPPGANPAGER